MTPSTEELIKWADGYYWKHMKLAELKGDPWHAHEAERYFNLKAALRRLQALERAEEVGAIGDYYFLGKDGKKADRPTIKDSVLIVRGDSTNENK